MKKLILLIFLGILFSQISFATEFTLCEEYTGTSTQTYGWMNPTGRDFVAQTFTITNGDCDIALVGVRVKRGFSGCSNTGNVNLTLYTTSTDPDTFIQVLNETIPNDWIEGTTYLEKNITTTSYNLVNETVYAFVWDGSKIGGDNCPYYFEGNNAYAGGQMWYDNAAPPGPWIDMGLDQWFKIYKVGVDTTPPTNSSWNVTTIASGGNSNAWNGGLQANFTNDNVSFTFTANEASNWTCSLTEGNYTQQLAESSNNLLPTTEATLQAGTGNFNMSVGNQCMYCSGIDASGNQPASGSSSSGCLNTSAVDNIQITLTSVIPLNSSGEDITTFNTSNLEEIETMNLTFTVLSPFTNITDWRFNFTANGSGSCALGNKQSDFCWNFSNSNSTRKWIEFVNGSQTDTFDGTEFGRAAGDGITPTVLKSSDNREWNISLVIDEHYNPNVFKHYKALYNFSDVKFQDGVNQRITGNTIIRIHLGHDIIPLNADQYKLDIRINTSSTLPNQPLEGHLCNSTFELISGNPVGNPACALVAEKLPSELQDDGTKFRGILTKQLIDELGGILYLLLRTDENNPNRYYFIKTYKATAAGYATHWNFSNDNGATFPNLGDGYETESNINWFIDGNDPTAFIYNFIASNKIDSGFCYQESANESNQTGIDGDCSLNYTGKYSWTNLTGGCWLTPENTNDGNWSTSGAGAFTPCEGPHFFYINYTKPLNALSSSLWQVKAVSTFTNESILDSCWDYNPTKLLLRIGSPFSGTSAGSSCYSGSWIQIANYGGPRLVYEEAMWWNISTEVINNLIGNVTWDIDPNQSYSPLVEFITPTVNQTITCPFNITWSSDDPNDDNLNISLFLFKEATLNQTIQTNMNQSNTTFNWNCSSTLGTFNLTIEAKKIGNEGFNSSDTHQIIIDQAPVVTLNSPSNGALQNTTNIVDFNCSATDNTALVNISLYITNSTNSSFGFNESTNITGTSNGTVFTKTLSNGNYTWNCEACDNLNLCSFASNNFSVQESLTCFTSDLQPSELAYPVNYSILNWSDIFSGVTQGVSFWTFEDNASGTTTDIWGNNDGTIIGATFNSTGGIIGGAFEFDGDGDYIEIGQKFTTETEFTVSLWANKREEKAQWMFSNYIGATDRFGILGNGNAFFIFDDINNNGTSFGSTSVDLNQWYHLVATCNSSGKEFYIDGVLKGTHNSGACFDQLPIGITMLATKDGDLEFFNGTIDEVAIWNRSLSASEIQKVFNNRANYKGAITSGNYSWNFTEKNITASDVTRGLYLLNNSCDINLTIMLKQQTIRTNYQWFCLNKNITNVVTNIVNMTNQTNQFMNCTLDVLNISQTYINWNLINNTAIWDIDPVFSFT